MDAVFQTAREDYWLGGYMFNLVASELIYITIVVAFIIGTWPNVPWTLVQYGGIVLMIAARFLFFPFSRTLWLAWDLTFRPAAGEDFGVR